MYARIALGLLLLGNFNIAQTLMIEIDQYTQKCFYEYVRQKRTAYLTVGVVKSNDKLDIRLKAYGPFSKEPSVDEESKLFFNHMVITPENQNDENLQHNGFNYDSEHRGGWYKYCLDNSHSGYNGKLVNFRTEYSLTKAYDFGEEDEWEKIARKNHLDNAVKSLVNMDTFLTKIKNEQEAYKLRDARHQQTCDSNNSRLVWYTVVEIVLLAVVYGCQAFLINKWFEDRGLLLRQWA